RRRGRAKILRALQLSQMVQGVIQKLPLIRKPPAPAFGRKTAETSIQARANRPGAAGAQQKFLLFPLPARDAHDARRKRESSNSVPAYGIPIALARWGSACHRPSVIALSISDCPRFIIRPDLISRSARSRLI